nr:molt-inhibiting hormone-like [Procambarus clarkii]
MTPQVSSFISLQGVWVMVWMVALLGTAHQAKGLFVDDECAGVAGNRDIYQKVLWVCQDCSNIFRNHDVEVKCRKDCFYNSDFLWCVYASERHQDLEQFKRWISILRGARK